MANDRKFDVIIIGGSYSGLAAGMALGRALRKVLIIDSGNPCNRQTPYSHNFLTQDGIPPGQIATIARQQVEKYDSVRFVNGQAIAGTKREAGFDIQVASGETFTARKLIFATGISDIMPEIPGYAECWGITVLHCPFCHGYEVKNEKTGILGNGEYGFEFSVLISNWTKDLTLYTNGKSTLTGEQALKLEKHNIKIVETEIEKLEHNKGNLKSIVFKDGTKTPLHAIYTRNAFVQHCTIPETLQCALTEEGYIQVDDLQKTTVDGIFACGDNTTPVRSVANAVAMGTKAGASASREIILEDFQT